MKYDFFPYIKVLAVCLFCFSLLCGCGTETAKKTEKRTVAASSVATPEKQYDRNITGVIKDIDTDKSTVLVQDLMTAEETVLNYTEMTDVYNKYGDIKAIGHLALGDIVEAYFWSENNEIVKIQNCSNAWKYEDVRKFTIQREKEILRISDDNYQYSPVSLLVVQDSELIDLLAISDKDTLSIQGIGRRIYSITVTKGHGYVRFRHYDQFVGGMVEIGYGIIRNVTEDMLLTVPEGDYRMVMEHAGLKAEKEITVERGVEQTVDLGAYQTETEKTGRVSFVIEPEGAQLNINGVPTVYAEAVELSYGKNIIQVFQDGYSPYVGTLDVKRAYQVVKISLAGEEAEAEVVASADEAEENAQDLTEEDSDGSPENDDTENDDREEDPEEEAPEDDEEEQEEEQTEPDDDGEEEEPQDDSSDDSTISAADTGTTEVDKKHTITVNSPADVKVYVNDEYVGKSPVSFDKIIGTFTVALSKNGYKTASYTMTIEDDGENNYLSFPDLVEE